MPLSELFLPDREFLFQTLVKYTKEERYLLPCLYKFEQIHLIYGRALICEEIGTTQLLPYSGDSLGL